MMPEQKPGRSVQSYGTPREFIEAIERRFGPIVCDLACTRHNAKAPNGYYWPEVDSLEQDWAEDYPTGNLFLNPPFGRIGPDGWAAKCAVESRRRVGWIHFLTPAAVGTDWFANSVRPFAMVEPISPRLAFTGMAPNPKTGKIDGFPKDLMLSSFGYGMVGFQPWRWK